MASEVKPEFKKIEGIEELKDLIGKVIQIHNPLYELKHDQYAVGVLERVEESKRTIDGEEKTDIVVHLKHCLVRYGKPIGAGLYESAETKFKSREFRRVTKHEMGYIVMPAASD